MPMNISELPLLCQGWGEGGQPRSVAGEQTPSRSACQGCPTDSGKGQWQGTCSPPPKVLSPTDVPPSQGTGPWHLVDQSSILCVLTSHTAEPNECSGGRTIAKDPVWHQPGPAPAVFPWPDQATEPGPAHICALEKGKQGRVRGWGCSVLHKPDSSQKHL